MRTLFGLALFGLLNVTTSQMVWADDHKGPHGGIVVEWGDEELHPELVLDQTSGTLTVYIYGNHDDLHKKKLKAIDAKNLTLVLKTSPTATTVKLNPTPEKDDPKGSATKFTATNDVFKKNIKWVGTISGKVGAKPYSGDFK